MFQLVIIILYLSAMILIGIFSQKQTHSKDDFFVAGRKGSSFNITGSLFATIVGGSATIGMAGLGFSRGITGIWWLLVGTIGLVILGLFFARRVRDFGFYTLPELVERQYDSKVGLASSLLISIAWLGVIAGQIVAAGKILGVLGIGDSTLWMIVFTLVFVTYTVTGGQRAVLKTDTWQSIIIFIGIFSGLVFVLTRLGGFDRLWAQLPSDFSSFPISEQFGTYDLIKTLFLVGLTYVVGPDMYSRIFSAKDSGTARRAIFTTSVLILPLAFAIVLLGMSARVLFPDIVAEQAFPMIIKEVLPPVFDGLILAALLCALMSSADTCVLSASTILSVDIIQKFKPSFTEKQVIVISRILIFILGAISLGLALFLKGVINSLLFAYTIYTAGLIPLVLAGFYRDKLKVTPLAAFIALIGGGVLGLISQLMKIKYLDLGALGLSISLLFIVSFIQRRIKSGRGTSLPDQ